MAVPEASVDEDHLAVPRKNEIRPARKRVMVETKPIPHAVDELPHE